MYPNILRGRREEGDYAQGLIRSMGKALKSRVLRVSSRPRLALVMASQAMTFSSGFRRNVSDMTLVSRKIKT